MQAQLDKAGTPAPKAIGIDEISIRKGHTYRIVVVAVMRKFLTILNAMLRDHAA